MTRTQTLHLLGLIATVLIVVLIGSVSGAWDLAGWLVTAIVIVLHGGTLAAVIAWWVRRMKRGITPDD